VKRLIRHKEASLVLDEVYSQYANSAQRMSLMEEFYGPEFAVFKSNDGPSTLEGLIEKHPMKKQSILKYLRSAIDSVLEKATFNVGKTPILHRAILDYLNVADESVSKDMIEMLKDHLVHMLHTREGALVTQYCILHATPKDRKQIIKSFKGFIHSIAKEQYGHAVLITCFECVDDTVLVGKAIIGELFKPATSEGTVGELLSNQYGSRVILFLLCGRNKRYQPIYLIEELEKTDAVRAKTTKKESDIRHKQLLEVTSPFLLESVAEHANELLHDKQGSAVLVETLNNAVGDLMPLIKAVSDLCAKAANGNIESFEKEKSDQVVNVIKKMKVEKESEIQLSRGLDLNESVLVNRFSTLAIKHLLLKPKEGDIPGWKLEFGQNLWEAIKPNFEKLVTYCSNNPRTAAGLAFILVALFENSTELLQKNMNSIAKKFKKKCLVLVSESKGNKEIIKEAGDTKKRKSSEKECGIEILLHQL
jgi:pumilio family protein 6